MELGQKYEDARKVQSYQKKERKKKKKEKKKVYRRRSEKEEKLFHMKWKESKGS